MAAVIDGKFPRRAVERPGAGRGADDVLADVGMEAAVIGGVLIDNASFGVVGFLQADDFADEAHYVLFSLIERWIGAGRVATASSLQRDFHLDETDDSAAGAQYLIELQAGAARQAGDALLEYARIIQDLAIRRRIRTTLGDAQQRISGDHEAFAPMIAADLAADVAAITKDASGTNPTTSAADVADRVLDEIERVANGEVPRGISTGLAPLDAAIGRMEGGELWIVGARPGMGKTALMLTMSLAISRHHGPAFIVSLEMSARQIGLRLLSATSGVPGFFLREGRLKPDDLTRLGDAREALAQLPLQIYVDRDSSVEAVVANARRMHQTEPLAAVFVDYLQLMRSARAGQRENRVQELSAVSGALKSLALELDVPVIALSQLNRGVEGREDKRPNMADIRESGAIEQDADGVLMLYREEEYHRRTKPRNRSDVAAYADWQAEHAELKGRAEILVVKHRSGEGGQTVDCGFHGPTTTFRDDPPGIPPDAPAGGPEDVPPPPPDYAYEPH